MTRKKPPRPPKDCLVCDGQGYLLPDTDCGRHPNTEGVRRARERCGYCGGTGKAKSK